MSGRWADTEEDKAAEARRRREKEEKKRLKAERQQQREKEEAAKAEDRASKKQKLSQDEYEDESKVERPAWWHDAPQWGPCRLVENFERLNHIEEGSYGFVSRAREIGTGEIVALKKLKIDGADTGGFPVTGLREIQCLMQARHRHVVGLREVVVGKALNEIYLVMDFLEHDLKTLQEDMAEPFMPSETKTLLMQLASAVDFLHSNWILHRDLKTSNILMNNRGEIKIADFGMARFYGDPAPKMTQLVVTLWYRAPELLLGTEKYDESIDVWSMGCVFGELLTREPLIQGKNELDQLVKTFELCGVPNDETWPGFKRLPNARSLRLPPSRHGAASSIRAKFPSLTAAGCALLDSMLSLNPAKRPSASDILRHAYFAEHPRPKSTAMFPTFPSKAGQEKRRRISSPSAPNRGEAPRFGADANISGIFASRDGEETGAGFQLKLV